MRRAGGEVCFAQVFRDGRGEHFSKLQHHKMEFSVLLIIMDLIEYCYCLCNTVNLF